VPLCLLVFEEPALIRATISTVLTAVTLFALGIAAIEFVSGGSTSPWGSLAKAGRAVVRNPLVVATLAGMAWSATGLAMPRAPQRVLALLAGAAAPCALASIGASLAEPVPAGRAHPVSAIVVAKLVLQPAVCALLAFGGFRLPAPWAQCAVLLSALPTGTGPFMLAGFYGRDAARASRVMFVTTAASLATVPACIAMLRREPAVPRDHPVASLADVASSASHRERRPRDGGQAGVR
jgi:predicted permease